MGYDLPKDWKVCTVWWEEGVDIGWEEQVWVRGEGWSGCKNKGGVAGRGKGEG